MLIKKADDIKGSEITDKKIYLSRRVFMRGAALAASTVATGFLYRKLLAPEAQLANPPGGAAPGVQASAGRWALNGEAATRLSGHHDLQQLLRVRHGQVQPRAPRAEARHATVDSRRRRAGQQA